MTVVEYNTCVDKYSDGVYRFILKNTGDEETAKDIVQDAFFKMWEKVKQISYEKSRSYLFTTAYHNMIDLLRKEKRANEYNEANLMESVAENNYTDIKEVLDEAVSRLPDIQRSVVLLRDYEGYSYEEIGNITGLNESQVKVYIYRARMFLKQYIGSLDRVI